MTIGHALQDVSERGKGLDVIELCGVAFKDSVLEDSQKFYIANKMLRLAQPCLRTRFLLTDKVSYKMESVRD
ncbi:MAG: hypothetical protein JWO19_6006 [Bryobacterales bacterium]|jgi:hypothetical protein|nr:hypothetical protein [Bryobacterales bacterium]